MNGELEQLARKLIDRIQTFESVAVAFSGGVDSGVVAAAAYRALGSRSVAITGIGNAVAQSELSNAREVAKAIGIRHIELSTHEIQDANYVRNDASRCYHCKTNLYSTLLRWTTENGFRAILSGANLDDLGDYRPGLKAASEHQVVSPLADLEIDKASVRHLANYFELSIADKPASPCLASRIAYGQSVTAERLERIERAESFLHRLGFIDVRVRLHADDLARLEFSAQDILKAFETNNRSAIVTHMKDLGFKFVTLDLGGRQSGSLNQVLPIIQLR
jgi:pyridinium-3,5-biscarboxylic acid mononucleotide sulfurtransferase